MPSFASKEHAPTQSHSHRDRLGRCLVVMYHYVHDSDSLSRPCSSGVTEGVCGRSVSDFCAQLDELCRRLEPTDWPALVAAMEGRESIPRESFLLTFDDGLADHAEVVLPMLEDRGLHGVFFVPGAVLATHKMLPAHALHLLLSTLGAAEVVGEWRSSLKESAGSQAWLNLLDGVPGPDAVAAEALYGYESPELARLKYLVAMKLPINLRNQTIEKMFEKHVGSSARWSRHWYLGWDDLARLESLGHTIGGHGYRHDAYARMNAEETRDDVLRCAAVLRDGLGADRRPLSYPYGSFTEAAKSALAEAGFVHAFTTEQGWVRADAEPFRMPRYDTIHVQAAWGKTTTCPLEQHH